MQIKRTWEAEGINKEMQVETMIGECEEEAEDRQEDKAAFKSGKEIKTNIKTGIIA